MKEYTSHGISHFYCPMAHHWVSQSGNETGRCALAHCSHPCPYQIYRNEMEGQFLAENGSVFEPKLFQEGMK